MTTLAGRVLANVWPFELVTSFTVQLLTIAAVVLAAAAAVRAYTTVLIAAACVILTGLPVANTLRRDPLPAQAGAERLTLGHLNAQTRPIDVAALGRYLVTTRPDLFVVLDPDQSDVALLTHVAPGYQARTSSSHAIPRSGFVRTVVLSRVPVTGVRHPTDPDFGSTAVELTTAGGAPTSILALGTDSPITPGRARSQHHALAAAARWSRAAPPRRVVMGDFNATPWSAPLQRLLRDGDLVNSLDGFGLQVSWPEANPLIQITIDQALLGPALATTDRGTGPAFGSQHRSLHLTVASRG